MHHADHRRRVRTRREEKSCNPVELSCVNLARLRPPVRLPGLSIRRMLLQASSHLGLGGFHRAHMARVHTRF